MVNLVLVGLTDNQCGHDSQQAEVDNDAPSAGTGDG